MKHIYDKLVDKNPESLTAQELFALLISRGYNDRQAEQIATDTLSKYGSFQGLANQPLESLGRIRNFSEDRIIRLTAAYELARRICKYTQAQDDIFHLQRAQEFGLA